MQMDVARRLRETVAPCKDGNGHYFLPRFYGVALLCRGNNL